MRPKLHFLSQCAGSYLSLHSAHWEKRRYTIFRSPVWIFIQVAVYNTTVIGVFVMEGIISIAFYQFARRIIQFAFVISRDECFQTQLSGIRGGGWVIRIKIRLIPDQIRVAW